MRVLVLLSRIPWPLEKGDKLRAYHHLKVLSQKHQISLVCLTDSTPHPDANQQLSPFCQEIHFIKLSKIRILGNLATSIFNDKPFQVNYFYQKIAQKKVRKIIEDFMPKHLFVQLVRTAEYVKDYHVIHSTFDYMDAFSTGAERRVDKAIPILKTLLSIEAKRLKKYENFVFNHFTHKTIISPMDRDLIEHPEKNQIIILPNGVDFEEFSNTGIQPKKYDLVFTGNMSYPPNIKAAHFLANEIIPLLLKTHPTIQLAIAGAEPNHTVKKLASKNITITGWMDQLTLAYEQSTVFIAPMQIGTGMQNKILEAMAMNIPCITSPLAAGAIGATHRDTIFIADNPKAYVNGIIELLSNPSLRDSIAANALNFVHANFDWNKNGQILENLISSEK